MVSKEKELDIVSGIVTRYWAPSPKGEGSGWKPAKLVIETDDGGIDLVEWPKKDYETKVVIEPIVLPQFDRLSLDDIEGKTIKALAVADGEYQGRAQWVVNTNGYTKVVGGDPKPEPKPEPDTQPRVPDTRPPASSLDQRIAWNSGINNAVHAIGQIHETPVGEDWNARYVERIDALAHSLFQLIMRGPRQVETSEPEEQEPEEEASLGVLSANGGGE
jgi:hypothetical protein